KPGFTPPPAPVLSGTPGEGHPAVLPTPLPPVLDPSPYSTPPELRPPTPVPVVGQGNNTPTPPEDALPITDPTATVMSGQTPVQPLNPPTPPPEPAPDEQTPALDQAQIVSSIPAPENVVAP